MKPRLRVPLTALLCRASVTTHTASPARSAERQVTGTLLESASYLEPSSACQRLSLDELSAARLSHMGDQGAPVALKLQDCMRSDGGRYDEQQGALVWSAIEPVVAVIFKAVGNADTPGLIKVFGAEGSAYACSMSRVMTCASLNVNLAYD